MLENRDINKLIRIEESLKSKISEKKIEIRDILVSRADETGLFSPGEFGRDNKETTNDLLARMIQHIKNMAKIAVKYHIADNFMPTGDYGMRPTHENNITRLSFNEFTFYPSAKRGPLTELEFTELMVRVVNLAKELPPNLHLALSSFPVVDAEGNVHNVISYVQCRGKSADPIITNFAKAYPDEDDYVYPGTKNVYFTQGYRTKFFAIKIERYIGRLSLALKDDKDFKKANNFTDILLSHCDAYPDLAPRELVSLLKELNYAITEESLTEDQAIAFAEKLTIAEKGFRKYAENLEDETKKLAKERVDHLPAISMTWDENFMLTALHKELNTLLNNLESKPPFIDGIAIAKNLDYWHSIGNFPSKQRIVTLFTSLVEQNDISPSEIKHHITELPGIIQEIDDAVKRNKERGVGSGWSYGGHVHCVTEGGAEFTTAIDICMDHTSGVAKRSHQRDILRGMQSLDQIMDSKADHLISSYGTNYAVEHIISPSFVQVDKNPSKSGVFNKSAIPSTDSKKQSSKKLDSKRIDTSTLDSRKRYPEEEFNVTAAFASKAQVNVSQIREIGKISTEEAAFIDTNNELFVKIEALRILASQGQVPLDKINRKLIQDLAEFAVKDFEGILPEREIAQLQQLAECEIEAERGLNKEGVHIHSDSLGTVFLQVRDRLKDPAQLLPLLSQFFAESKKAEAPLKQLIARTMLNQVIDGCEHWSKLNPQTQKQVLALMNDAILKNDRIDFSNPQQLNKIVDGLKNQLKEAIFEKTGWRSSLYQSATKQYDINFDSGKGLSNTGVNSLIKTVTDVGVKSSSIS